MLHFIGILVGVVNGPAFGISVTTLALFDIVYAVNTAFFKYLNFFNEHVQARHECVGMILGLLFPNLVNHQRDVPVTFSPS